MKITVAKALQSIQGLISLNSSGKLPMHLSLTIAHNARELDMVQVTFQEKRNEMLKEYGEEVDGRIKIHDDKIEEFTNLGKELEAEELDLPLRTVKASKFPEDYRIEPLALVALEWMIEEEE